MYVNQAPTEREFVVSKTAQPSVLLINFNKTKVLQNAVTYFPNEYLATFCTSLDLILIYYRCNLRLQTQISCSKV